MVGKSDLIERTNGNGNSIILDIMLTEAGKYFRPEDRKVLDIASDKEPVFCSKMAIKYPNSIFTHFKDNERLSPKISTQSQGIRNLQIIYSESGLKPPYDISTGFFTLHELENPENSIRKAYQLLKDAGRIVVVDYDLRWFKRLAQDMGWDKQTAKENFSREIFTANNECSVLGMRNGFPISSHQAEAECVNNHTRFGLDDYVSICSHAGFKQIYLKEYKVPTSWGEKPKMLMYIGEKTHPRFSKRVLDWLKR